MDSDLGKLFIGGISWETSEEKLKEHFEQYGEVLQTVIMRDKVTNRPRGFGFVAFADPAILDRVLADKHVIDGRTVEAKRALSRDEQQSSARSGGLNVGRTGSGGGGGGGAGGDTRTKKIFVGGLAPNLTDDGLRHYFQSFGTVTDTVVMYDAQTQRPRGFGFVTFDSEDSVDKVLHHGSFHGLNGKSVEVKRALPRDSNPGNTGGRATGGGATGGGGAGGYANTGSYERPDANRFSQPQPGVGGGLPMYGSGYGGPAGYGYSAPNQGAGYGGYGSAPAAAAAYGGGPTSGGYGNPNTGPASGYGSEQLGGLKSPWNSQPSSGYGTAGYGGNTGYGGAGLWNAPGGGGGAVAPPTGQPTSQGYGYGGYGGPDGPYGGYGAAGGRASAGPVVQAGGPGEQGGYGGANGSSGYQTSWKADPSGYGSAGQVSGPPGAPAAYGGGYGGASYRQ